MKCLYCDRHLGFFHKGGKGAFCSKQHEELYRDAAQRRLETPYAPSAGTLENPTAQAEVHGAQAEDLAKLLKATQADSGSSVETPAEVVFAAESADAVMASVSNSVAAMNPRALPQIAHGGPPAHSEPPSSPAASRPEEAAPISDAKMPAHPEPTSAPISAFAAEETDRRSEPRVKDIKIVKVAILRNPECEMNCALVDTSETGIQFTSDADFPVGEILIVELPDQVVLTEVRYSQAKDGRYAIGAERAQSVSKDAMSQATTGLERAGVLIEALCNRVRNGFSEKTGHGADAAASDQRERALERVAKILEIWQSMKSERAPQAEPPASSVEPLPDSTQEIQAEARHPSGAGRALAAVAACLVLAGLLTLWVVEFRNNHAVTAPNRDRQGVGALSEVTRQVKPQPQASSQVAQQIKPQPVVPPVMASAPLKAEPALPVTQHAPAPPIPGPKAAPIATQPAIAATGTHHAQIKAIETTWVGISTDGKKIFGAMITRGSTKDLEYSKFAFVHAGNAAGIEITVDGQSIPMGKQPRLRLVELNSTGYQFLRWTNDDPPQP